MFISGKSPHEVHAVLGDINKPVTKIKPALNRQLSGPRQPMKQVRPQGQPVAQRNPGNFGAPRNAGPRPRQNAPQTVPQNNTIRLQGKVRGPRPQSPASANVNISQPPFQEQCGDFSKFGFAPKQFSFTNSCNVVKDTEVNYIVPVVAKPKTKIIKYIKKKPLLNNNDNKGEGGSVRQVISLNPNPRTVVMAQGQSTASDSRVGVYGSK